MCKQVLPCHANHVLGEGSKYSIQLELRAWLSNKNCNLFVKTFDNFERNTATTRQKTKQKQKQLNLNLYKDNTNIRTHSIFTANSLNITAVTESLRTITQVNLLITE